MFKLDREKYLQILRQQGLSAAITLLHEDARELEFATFEGQAGYRPELWDELQAVRKFSRELWDHVLT
jgi:hypothetical protein